MPKHLLEASYLSDKQDLTNLPYWTEGFVGTGPYRLATCRGQRQPRDPRRQ